MPAVAGLSILTLQLEDLKGTVLHHNFVHFEIISETACLKQKYFPWLRLNLLKQPGVQSNGMF
jgi:hypothetical protein